MASTRYNIYMIAYNAANTQIAKILVKDTISAPMLAEGYVEEYSNGRHVDVARLEQALREYYSLQNTKVRIVYTKELGATALRI